LRRKRSAIGLVTALCLVLSGSSTLAQEEIAAAGNGGTAECAANGGAVATGDVNSGTNSGSAIGIGDSWGDVAVEGGAIANSTDLGIGADGGTGICDASGGEENVAFEVDPAPAPPPGPGPVPPPPPPPPPPPGPEPITPFQVCITVIGGPSVCGAGACDAASGPASCTLVDCSAITGIPGPCTVFSPACEVAGNVGNCTIISQPV
jgi:hypothetical protein